ncbi:acylphosphatase [Hoeflea sp. TYP-13]|uniref:acylphosphatase n=1 Tax=Hoeflea sp. TYP-13 TaxID=3230023 RepID=UPI0034C5F197
MTTHATVLAIHGQLQKGDFPEFAGLYASRLNLSGRFSFVAENQIEIVLSGPPELIDMFEVACWLGPKETIVDRIDVRPSVPLNTPMNGFRISPVQHQ